MVGGARSAHSPPQAPRRRATVGVFANMACTAGGFSCLHDINKQSMCARRKIVSLSWNAHLPCSHGQAEMVINQALFCGNSELHQLLHIFSVFPLLLLMSTENMCLSSYC